jgi:carboxylesterase type B
MGDSAGGGSIVHQIAAYGGKYPVGFQQAIPQSPGCNVNSPGSTLDVFYAAFLKNLNVVTLEEARSAPWDKLWQANNDTIGSGVAPSKSFLS